MKLNHYFIVNSTSCIASINWVLNFTAGSTGGGDTISLASANFRVSKLTSGANIPSIPVS